MKVQQHAQSLRLRVDESELARLLAGETVADEIAWPDGRRERRELALAREDGWSRTSAGWRITLAAAPIRDLAARLPSRDGRRIVLPAGHAAALEVLFDVDVRDSARRRRERAGTKA